MKHARTTYTVIDPPKTLRKAQLDNIALVPASLLSHKGKYQTITSNLPKGGILICETPQKPRIAQILERVAAFLRDQGHFVKTLPLSWLLTVSVGQMRPLRTPHDISLALPIPQNTCKIERIHLLIFTKGEWTLCRGFSPSSRV